MAERTYYGGQAIIEGVMMRGKRNMVTAVRRPNGTVAIETQSLHKIYTGRWRKFPLVRGVIVLIEALVLGIQTLMYSANVALEDEKEQVSGGYIWLILIVAMAFAVAVFVLGPFYLTKLLDHYFDLSNIVFNLIEGIIRLIIFIAYLRLISLMPDIRRVFAYHGAEHMAVNAYEAGVPLELEAVKKYNTAHVRCGTSFLFAFLVIAIIVFALVGRQSAELMVAARIILIPVIAALGYEFTYFGARHVNNRVVRVLLKPGLWLQALTTRQPDDSQLEVSISALSKVVELDQLEEVAQPAL